MTPRAFLPGSLARRVLFAATALILGTFLFLALLEGALRVAGFGHPMGFVLEEKGPDGRESWVSNPFFIERFVSAKSPLDLTFHPVPFRLGRKATGAVRVFVLGESAAYGDPDPAFGLSRFLQVLLGRKYPGVRFEVVNVAIPTLSSSAILFMARPILQNLSPDLLVLHMGNNEIVGPYGLLSPVGHNQFLVKVHQALISTRVGQLVQRVRRAIFLARVRGNEALKRYIEMHFRVGLIPAFDPRLSEIRGLFSRNYGEILSEARHAGVGVVLGTPGCNLGDMAPFAPVHGPGVGPDKIAAFDRAMAKAAGTDDLREAARLYQEAVDLDPGHAEARFQLGKSLSRLGEYAGALAEFKAARDADALRFRMDSAELDMIRKSVGSGAVLADAEKALETASPHGIPGAALFFDHVHMRVSGNYVAARSILEAAGGLLPAAVREKAAQGRVATLEECLAALPFTDWDRLRQAMAVERSLGGLLNRQTSDHGARLAAIQQEARDLSFAAEPPALERAREAYERVLAGPDASWMAREKYANLLLYGLEDVARAGREAERVLGEVDSVDSLFLLSVVENEQGRHEKALEHLGRLADLRPDSLEIRLHLLATRAVLAEAAGKRLLGEGRESEARKELSRAAELRETLAGFGMKMPGTGE